jgi:hypothetical protein
MVGKPAGSVIPDDKSYHNKDSSVLSYSLKSGNDL